MDIHLLSYERTGGHYLAHVHEILRDPMLRLLTIALFLSGAMYSFLMPYQALIGISILGIGNGHYAIMMLASSLVSVTGSVIIGILSDQWRDRRPLVIGSLGAGALGQAMVFFLRSPEAFVLANIALIPVAGSVYSQFFAAIKRALINKSSDETDQVISTIRAVFALSWIIAPPLLSVAIGLGMPVIGVYLAASCTCLLCLLLCVWFWRDEPREAEDAHRTARFLIGIGELVRPSIVYRLIVIGIIMGSQRLYMGVLGLVIIHSAQGSQSDIGIFIGAFSTLEVVFVFLGGIASKLLSKSMLIVLGSVIFAAFLAGLASVESVYGLYYLIVPGALGNAVIVSITIGYLQERVPSKPGAGSSLISVVSFIGSSVFAAAFAYGATGSNYSGTAMLGALLSLIGAAALFFLDFVPKYMIRVTK